MKTNAQRGSRWFLVVGYLGVMALTSACLGIGVLSANAAPGTLQVDGNVVEMVDENGDAVPVGSDATFDIVAKLENTDPWTVAGKTLETNDATQIDDGLQVEDLVRARGIILEDGTWLASSIQAVEAQSEPIIVLIGKVDSTDDPWVVNGITLTVTDTTDIQGTIDVGMLVRVEILLHDDGTWEALSIAPLGEPTEVPDCTTVVATVVAVNGDEVQFLGWPITVTLGESVKVEGSQGDEGENTDEQQGSTGTLSPSQVVLVVVCTSDDGQLIIAQIIILTPGESTPPSEGEMVTVCHKPGKNQHTLTIPSPALPAHLGHGDTLGACP